MLSLITVLLLGGLVTWFMLRDEPEETWRFTAAGNPMAATEFGVRAHMGSDLLSAFVWITENRSSWTSVNSYRLQAICGALLTKASNEWTEGFDRKDVFRVEITFNANGVGRDRDRRHDNTVPVTVREGTCHAPTRLDETPLSMPGRLRHWDLVTVRHDHDNRQVIVSFDPTPGVVYAEAIESFDPAEACRAALAEEYKSDVTPLDQTAFDTMQVVARNQRGNSLLYFETYQAWVFDVAGSLCLHEKGVAG